MTFRHHVSAALRWFAWLALVAASARNGDAATWFVDKTTGSDAADGSSWVTAKRTIGAGLSAAEASPGADSVAVAAGIYAEQLVVPPDVVMEGGFPPGGGPVRDPVAERTIITGIGTGPVVSFGPGTDASVIDGFTVRGGITTGLFQGAGIDLRGTAASVLGCVVEANRSCRGGAIYIDARGLTILPRVWDTVIRGNTASCADVVGFGGGLYVRTDDDAPTAQPLIRGCLVEGNVAELGPGVGISADILPGGLAAEGTLRVESSWFRRNRGSGAAFWGGAPALLFNCEFSDHPGSGLVLACPGDHVLASVTAARNGASGIVELRSELLEAPWSLDLRRSITWGNGTKALPRGCFPVMARTIDDCLVDGGEPLGTDILDADPLFVAGPGGDFYLGQVPAGQALDSPAADAGNITAGAAGLDTSSTRTDSGLDSGPVDHGVHYPAFGVLTVLRNTAPTGLSTIGTVTNLPYDDVGVFPDPARPLLFYRVDFPINEIHVTKVVAPGTVRLTF